MIESGLIGVKIFAYYEMGVEDTADGRYCVDVHALGADSE